MDEGTGHLPPGRPIASGDPMSFTRPISSSDPLVTLKGRVNTVLSRLPVIAFVLPLALGVGMGGISAAEEMLEDPDVVLVMKDKAFHVIKGAQPGNPLPNPAFSLKAGMDLVILLRNEDEVAHEFVSPLLMKAEDLQISGRATIVYTLTAFGVRVEPRERVMLRFEVPDASFDRFHFWCNIHGKLLDDTMRGEIFILDAKDASK
jgi:uncharacterized cupredoxin-like copper-binding protein